MQRDGRNGLYRVVLLYREENFDAALEAFRTSLGVTDFGKPYVPAGVGLRIAISWESGLELITPHGDEGYAGPIRQHLAAKGEGMFGLIYRVGDIGEAERRAAAAGYPRQGERIDCFEGNPTWRERFDRADEARLAPIAGIDVTLIQLDPKQ